MKITKQYALPGLVIIMLIAIIVTTQYTQQQTPDNENKITTTENFEKHTNVKLTKKAQIHILYGDEKGGGHKYGTGKPCKSEFPATWHDEKIIKTITRIAANDNLDWRKESNGLFVAEQTIENLRIRVVTNPIRTEIVTAYPINVRRNPCPPKNKNIANDNEKISD